MLVFIVSGWSQVLWNDCSLLREVCREYELAIAHFQWLKLLHFCYHQLAYRTYKARQQTQDTGHNAASQHPPLCPIDQLLITRSTEFGHRAVIIAPAGKSEALAGMALSFPVDRPHEWQKIGLMCWFMLGFFQIRPVFIHLESGFHRGRRKAIFEE